MYLTPNFEHITTKCYIAPQSTSFLVQSLSAHELRSAAQTSLLASKPTIDERAIYLEAEQAFTALDTYVSEGLKTGRKPTSLLDAAIFSYIFLLLGLEERAWKDRRLVESLQRFNGLREHMELIKKHHFRARLPSVWRSLNQAA